MLPLAAVVRQQQFFLQQGTNMMKSLILAACLAATGAVSATELVIATVE